MTCLVPGCKSNYHSQGDSYVPTFSFPTDVETREKWFRAIPRPKGDYEENKRFLVCIHHFREDIERNIKYYNGVEMIKMPRKKVVLRNLQFLVSFQIVQLISQMQLLKPKGYL
ncbi:Zinc finger protein [Oopsacas minuta]|uniref:Zinc finger protein n=1 Tax=Oopsacas minuta TaxID=111878 RepID=A0AAV7KJ23_9METZ|nr:Zinc finger protein [Oopsacas minuta]